MTGHRAGQASVVFHEARTARHDQRRGALAGSRPDSQPVVGIASGTRHVADDCGQRAPMACRGAPRVCRRRRSSKARLCAEPELPGGNQPGTMGSRAARNRLQSQSRNVAQRPVLSCLAVTTFTRPVNNLAKRNHPTRQGLVVPPCPELSTCGAELTTCWAVDGKRKQIELFLTGVRSFTSQEYEPIRVCPGPLS